MEHVKEYINKDGIKVYVDKDGGTWTKDGAFILDESAPGSLMDRIERRINGEDVPPWEEENK